MKTDESGSSLQGESVNNSDDELPRAVDVQLETEVCDSESGIGECRNTPHREFASLSPMFRQLLPSLLMSCDLT